MMRKLFLPSGSFRKYLWQMGFKNYRSTLTFMQQYRVRSSTYDCVNRQRFICVGHKLQSTLSDTLYSGSVHFHCRHVLLNNPVILFPFTFAFPPSASSSIRCSISDARVSSFGSSAPRKSKLTARQVKYQLSDLLFIIFVVAMAKPKN